MKWTDPIVIILAVAIIPLAVVAILAIISSTPSLKEMFVGVRTNPLLVALVRMLLVYVAPIAIAAAIAYVNNWTDPRLLPLVPILVGGLRQLEGVVDKWLKPRQNTGDAGTTTETRELVEA